MLSQIVHKNLYVAENSKYYIHWLVDERSVTNLTRTALKSSLNGEYKSVNKIFLENLKEI